MKKEEVSPSLLLVKALSYALKQFRLYSDTHPITQQAITALSTAIEGYFQQKPKITLGSMRKLLVVDGEIIGEKDIAANDVAKELDRLGVEGLTIERGIDLAEMTSFLLVMAMRIKNLEEQGGFRKVFDAKGFKHVRITSGKYELVEEGQVLADKGMEPIAGVEPAQNAEKQEEIASPPQLPKSEAPEKLMTMSDVIARIRSDSTATQEMPAIDAEKLVMQIEKNPQEIAINTIENVQDIAAIETTLRKVVRFLVDGLMSYLVEQGKDISKALQKLAKELEKAVERSFIDHADLADIKKKIPAIFEEASMDLRVQMMVQTAKANPGDKKTLQKMAGKLLKDEEVREKISGRLQEEMKHVGVAPQEVKEMISALEEKEAKKKSKVSIDADELEELRKKAELFEKGGGGDTTVLMGKINKLEREKKIITDEKERVDNVIRNLAEGVLVVDKKGEVVLMNPAAEKLLGVKQKDKIGKKVTEGLKDEHMVSLTKGNLRDHTGEVSKNVEVVSLNDDTRKVLQASTAVIENEDGQTVGMVSVLSDITKQKEVEELKTKFVSHVSHELRTPLVAIQKSLALVIGKELGDVNPEQQKFLDMAHRNIDRLSRLINDLLDVSKMEAGAMNLQPKPIRLSEVVISVMRTLETWAKDKKVKLISKFADENLLVEVDMDRMTQVLTNLAGNALKFTPESGSITFDITAVIKDAKGEEWVEVGVRDTGIGIAPEDQKKIFDKFVQVSLAQPAGVSSTGLGLTIVKEIIELHSGEIWVESEDGKGSRFAFKIPVKFKPHEKL